jgi:putative peptidoglycan lipid II flippase
LSNKRLIKSTGIISLSTLTSRVLGFTRDILIANFFGTTIFAEAFVVSFKIPNLLRDLVGEGAANAAFVPILTEYQTTRSRLEFWDVSRNLMKVMVAVLALISLLGVAFAPVLVRIIAPGFIEDPVKLNITINLTRTMFPFIFLIGLVAYGMGVLNSLNHFTAPALGPVLLNISLILFIVFLCPKIGVKGLAYGVLVGGLLQVLLMAWILRIKGFHFAKKRTRGIFFVAPAVKRIWKLLIPRLFGSAVYQLSVIVDNIFSTLSWIVGVGAPAALWYSYRLFHLPLAIFGIALATVALPKMSGEVARKDIPALKDTVNFSLRGVFMVLVPAAVGLAILGRPIIRLLFQRGEFTAYSTMITYKALFFYSFGLIACGGIKILVNAFFSLGDTKTPVKVAGVSFFVNLTLNALLMWPLQIGGLALATSIAATSNFLMLYFLLTRRIGNIGTGRVLGSLGRFLLSGTAMGIFAFIASYFAGRIQKGFFADVASLVLIIILSVGVYVLSSMAFGVREIKSVAQWISKRP